jgi:hypothetical protein
MQREESTRALEVEQQQRAGEITMSTAKEVADERDGLYDAQDGTLLEPGLSPEQQQVLWEETQQAEGDEIIEPEVASRTPLGEHRVRADGPAIGPNGVPIIQPEDAVSDDSLIDLTDEAPAPLPEPAPLRQVQRVQRTERVTIVRVNSDLNMTYGQGTNSTWNLVKGRRYKLPIDVANHLHEKGLVATWG